MATTASTIIKVSNSRIALNFRPFQRQTLATATSTATKTCTCTSSWCVLSQLLCCDSYGSCNRFGGTIRTKSSLCWRQQQNDHHHQHHQQQQKQKQQQQLSQQQDQSHLISLNSYYNVHGYNNLHGGSNDVMYYYEPLKSTSGIQQIAQFYSKRNNSKNNSIFSKMISGSSSNSTVLLSVQTTQQYSNTSHRTVATVAKVANNNENDINNNQTVNTTTTRTTGTSTASSKSLNLYMWGTDTKGCLLRPKGHLSEQSTSTDSAAATSSSSSSSSSVIHTPTRVDELEGVDSTGATVTIDSVQSIVCGPTDTAVIDSTGKCYVSGENKHGQLGLGHTNPVVQLHQIQLPVEDPVTTTVKQVAFGTFFAAYVDSVGDMYTSGYGGSTYTGTGYLGHGDANTYLYPKLVESLVEDGCSVEKVVLGESHMTVLTTEKEVLTTGAGSYGRLGNFDTIDQLHLAPTEILTPESKVIDIAGGKSFTLALTADGIVYGWGRNHKGQLGTGLGLSVDVYAMQSIPEPIETDELINRKVVKIAAGQSHAACITESGELFYWGMSLFFEPVRVDSLLHTKIVNIACGQNYTLAIDMNGKMYSFGSSATGVLGNTGVLGQGSTVKNLNQPMHIESFGPNSNIRSISAGYKHVACLVQE